MDFSRAAHFLTKVPIRDRSSRTLIPFHLNPGQQILHRIVCSAQDKHKLLRFIVLKARRVGISSYTDGMAVPYCLSADGKKALIVAHKFKSSAGLIEVPMNIVTKCIPGQLPIARILGLPAPTKHQIMFPHGTGESTLEIATAGNVAGGRGLSFNYLHLSECAFYPAEESFSALLPTVPRDHSTCIVLESTANGRTDIGEPFYDYWCAAEEGQNEFIPVFIPWFRDPLCTASPDLAADAPRDDEEKWMMKDFKLTKAQIAWWRMTLETECRAYIGLMHQEYPTCLVAGTRVSTDAGIIPIEEARAGMVSESGTVVAAGCTGTKRCVTIHTDNGRVLHGTWDHPLETVDGRFVQLESSLQEKIKLRPPRFAAAQHEVSWLEDGGVVSHIAITPDYARLLGYFMGDGCYHGGTFSICCDAKDEDVIEDVRNLEIKYFGSCQVRASGTKKGGREVRVGSTYFAHVMRKLGIWNDAEKPHRKVCVPECIFRSPKEVVREFLRALFESDGFNGHRYARVSLFAKNLQFLRDVQLLLFGFGIPSRIRSRWTVNGQGFGYMANTLDLRSREVFLFKEAIGFIGKRKNSIFTYAPKANALPLEMFDTVVAMEPLASLPVYDMTIETKHTFSANGLVSHNTPEQAFVASGDPVFDEAEIKHVRSQVKPPLCYGEFTRGDSGRDDIRFREKSESDILIWELPEHRHGYYIGADAARGTEEGDFASFCVFDGSTGHLVARMAARINPEILADLLDKVGRYYNHAMVNVELTGNLGIWSQKLLRDTYYYPNLYRWKGQRDDKLNKSASTSIGWETGVRSREMAMTAFRAAVRERRMTIFDEGLVSQMDRATRKDGWRWEVERGHDDILMAATLGWIAREQWPPSKQLTGRVIDISDEANSPSVGWRDDVETTLIRHFAKIQRYDKRRGELTRLEGV
jgi:hypothetical protein